MKVLLWKGGRKIDVGLYPPHMDRYISVKD